MTRQSGCCPPPIPQITSCGCQRCRRSPQGHAPCVVGPFVVCGVGPFVVCVVILQADFLTVRTGYDRQVCTVQRTIYAYTPDRLNELKVTVSVSSDLSPCTCPVTANDFLRHHLAPVMWHCMSEGRPACSACFSWHARYRLKHAFLWLQVGNIDIEVSSSLGVCSDSSRQCRTSTGLA